MAITLLRRHAGQKPFLGARLDPTHPLARGLMAAYHLNEGGGTTLNDALGRSPATVAGGPPWISGPQGAALRFAGSGAQYAATPDAPWLATGAGDVTYEVWANPSSAQTGFLLTKRDSSVYTQTTLLIAGDSEGGSAGSYLCFLLYQGPPASVNERGFRTTMPVADGNWHHFVGVYSGSTASASLYVDGVAVPLTVDHNLGTPPNVTNTAPFSFGAGAPGGARPLTGSVAVARAWSRILSAAEVATLYTDPYALFQAPRLLSMVSATAIPTTVQDTGAGTLAPTPVSGYGVPSVDAGAGSGQATEATATTAAPLVSGTGTQTVTPLSGTSATPQSAGAGTTMPTPATGQAAPTTEAGAGGLTDTASSGQTAPLTDAGAGGVTPAPTVGASPSSTDAGTGTTTSTPATGQSASVLLPGAGGLVPTGASGQAASIITAGVGDLHSATTGAQPVSAALAGQGGLAPAPTAGQQQAATPSGAGMTTTTASTGQPVTTAPTGAGALADAPLIARQEAATATGAGDLPVTPIGQTALTSVAGHATDTGAGAATVTPTSGATGVTAAAGTGNDAASPLTGTVVGAPSSGAGSGVSTAIVGQTVPTSTTETGAGGLTPSTTPVRTAPTVYRAAYVALLAGGTEGEGAVVPIPLAGQALAQARLLPTDNRVGVTITLLDLPLGVAPAVAVTTTAFSAMSPDTLTLLPLFATLYSVAGNAVTLIVGTGAQAVGDVYTIDLTITNTTTHAAMGALRIYLPCAAF